jgi:hypothetical protein
MGCVELVMRGESYFDSPNHELSVLPEGSGRVP